MGEVVCWSSRGYESNNFAVVVPFLFVNPSQDTVQSRMCAAHWDVPVRLCFRGAIPISCKLFRRKSNHFLTGKSVSRMSTVSGFVDGIVGAGVVPKGLSTVLVGTGGVCGMVGFRWFFGLFGWFFCFLCLVFVCF